MHHPTKPTLITPTIRQAAFENLPTNLYISTSKLELVVTLDVGPRIISFRRLPSGTSIFKTYPSQLATTGESSWQIRGGHRLWTAPESDHSYALDNSPIHSWSLSKDTTTVTVQSLTPPFIKSLEISFPSETQVLVSHSLTNHSSPSPLSVAPWALTVCKPGGVEVIPLPPLGAHPRDLLPNQTLVLWPYTRLNDPRLEFGDDFVALRHDAGRGPIKLGLMHQGAFLCGTPTLTTRALSNAQVIFPCRSQTTTDPAAYKVSVARTNFPLWAAALTSATPTEGWIAYKLGKEIFVKRTSHSPGRDYPDHGCSFETFANEDMLEVETLGPLEQLHQGQTLQQPLCETWELHEAEGEAMSPREVLEFVIRC